MTNGNIDQPGRPTPEQEAAIARARRPHLDLNDHTALDRAEHWCRELIVLAKPRGRLVGLQARDRLSRGAQSLLKAIVAARLEIDGQGRP